MKIELVAPSGPPTWVTPSVEVAGAILTWDLHDPADIPPRVQVTSVSDATWLWLLFGEAGHLRIVEAISRGDAEVDVAAVDATSIAKLHRLAWGLWIQRWWPTSVVDAIDPLDATVLGVELALLIEDCEQFFNDEAFDSDVETLLDGVTQADIEALALHSDPEVRALYERFVDSDELDAATSIASGNPDDYALVAGLRTGPSAGRSIASGTTSIPWETVPADVFDAAENTVSWTVDAAPDAIVDVVVRLLPDRAAPPTDVGVRLGMLAASGPLSADGTVRITLPLSAAQAWSADWASASWRIGGIDPTAGRSHRVAARELVRRRLSGADQRDLPLFIAERLIVDSDY